VRRFDCFLTEFNEAQRPSIEAWAAREGVSVVAWHVDAGVSSVTAIDGRPALLAALASLREHGPGVLVVAKRDRIARDVVLTAGGERAAAPLATRQFHRAIAAGAIALLDEELKNTIYVAYGAADSANQHQARAVRAVDASRLTARTGLVMRETAPVLRQARDMLLAFASSEE
jgi:hypothetical protein